MIAAILLPFLLAAFGLFLLLRTGLAARLAADRPNHRSLHAQITPRVGGLVLVPAFLCAWLMAAALPAALMAAVAGLCCISFLDDRGGLPVLLRLAAQTAAAAMLATQLLGAQDWAWALVLVPATVLLTNLYNFMDGADGLAGGMALAGFSAYAWAAAGDAGLASACAAVAAAAAGFLLFNFPPARLFMGDAGSIPLGFAAAALGALGVQRGLWPAWFPCLVFSPFLVDAGLTLLRRLFRRERFWQAHRQHCYQRLIRLGWSHRRTALLAYALMLAAAASAVLALRLDPAARVIVLAAWCALYALLLAAVEWRWRASPLYRCE